MFATVNWKHKHAKAVIYGLSNTHPMSSFQSCYHVLELCTTTLYVVLRTMKVFSPKTTNRIKITIASS
jgi:hypothetical protein